jgi:aspartate aminotransferase-like enzyme/GNAT superfamily N-acetyltransferase
MVSSADGLTLRIATEDWEFDQIHRLNYRTFVEEIPQHARNATGRLVDKFHAENTYFVCLDGRRLVGMVALRARRPFSLDLKLPDLDGYLPAGRSLCEIRLLVVEPDHRRTRVIAGLLRQLAAHAIAQGYDCALISGTTRQQKLYAHLGFVPFGPLVGAEGARFQPMYCLLEDFFARVGSFYASEAPAEPATWSFLPGPVAMRPVVRRMLGELPVSHRSPAFMDRIGRVKRRLCRLTGARHVEILLGSGTLANDAVAGQLRLTESRGLILSNGEFGERLVDHARRAGLSFELSAVSWGEAFDPATVEREFRRSPSPAWVWAVHCETSTGVLNDLATLKALCGGHAAQLCLDCISSLGNLPVDLEGVWLATSVSGKGLGAFPGLALVFCNHTVPPAPDRLPRYLDLGLYAAHDGVPFTHSSNLVAALETALLRFDTGTPFAQTAALTAWLREQLRAVGLRLVAPDEHAAPAIVTIALPRETSAEKLGEQLEREGYLLSYRSGYLVTRNWIQIGLMGDCSPDRLAALLRSLARLV